jgi:hypothetical protein
MIILAKYAASERVERVKLPVRQQRKKADMIMLL